MVDLHASHLDVMRVLGVKNRFCHRRIRGAQIDPDGSDRQVRDAGAGFFRHKNGQIVHWLSSFLLNLSEKYHTPVTDPVMHF